MLFSNCHDSVVFSVCNTHPGGSHGALTEAVLVGNANKGNAKTRRGLRTEAEQKQSTNKALHTTQFHLNSKPGQFKGLFRNNCGEEEESPGGSFDLVYC